MGLAKKYRKSLDKQWCLRFKTTHPGGDCYDGVVTHIRPDFIILREERDLEFDGIVILPKKALKGYRDGKYERCRNEIIHENGAIEKCNSPSWLDSCETLKQLLTAMMQQDIWPGVEILFDKGADYAFYLGPITHIGRRHFYIKCYDAAGKWEKNYKLKYDEVFRIEFDSKYCNYFNAYMRRRIDDSH